MDHVILTRFNLPSPGRERAIRDRPGWLESRVELFERYCLPSVAAQANARVRWIIYFDPASPAWLRERTEAHAATGRYTPIFREEVSREELLADIRGVVGDSSDELLTTNLDNDDALASDFCERLQAAPRPAVATAYYFTNGLIRSPEGLHLQHDPDNAFPSVRTRWDGAITCWSAWHTRLRRSMPVVEIGGSPGWLQVVHGRNVSNRARGRLVAPQTYRGRFPGLIDDVATPSRSAVWRDRLVLRPVRGARSAAVRLLKPVLFRVLGPSGPDRIRQAAARARRS
jgi:hypothetical protein